MHKSIRHHRVTAGQSITEYILLIALIALVAFGAIKLLGIRTTEGLNKAANKVGEATDSSR